MKQEADFILREVKKLTLLITNLISKLNTSNSNELENGIRETDDFIRKKWGISLKEIASISSLNFINKFKELQDVPAEKLVELLSVLTKKMTLSGDNILCDKKELAKKGIILIDKLDAQSKTYSLKRMELKKELENQID